ncbi:MAG: GNAT family N-acetyltransferase [Actinomycetia bacterium]|nr:GNAT family N-acetyltransferase [Actinomycetes bacterium]
MSSERRDSAPGAATAPGRDVQRSPIELKTTDRRGRPSNNNGCRVQPWSFQPHIAHLVVNHQQPVPSLSDIRHWTERVHELGYSIVRTNALSRGTSRQMECAGYTVLQELVLLELNSPRAALNSAITQSGERLTTNHVGPEQIPDISAIDVDAFGTGWGLSETAVADVCAATPRHRLRGAGEPLAAFAISGRDGRQGFLQRLSVSSARQRQGLGRALVLDSLEWMTRWRVQRVLVNTAFDNHAALALYQGLGFRRIGERLRVYERTLP